jgi:hypothetical protein
MAARLNPRQDQRSRAAIQTTQLCRRLNSFALEELDPQTGKPVVMSDTQVRAALGLLRKTIPDLAVTTLRGDRENPVRYVIRGPTPVESTAEWLALHAPQDVGQPEVVIEGETSGAPPPAAPAEPPMKLSANERWLAANRPGRDYGR